MNSNFLNIHRLRIIVLTQVLIIVMSIFVSCPVGSEDIENLPPVPNLYLDPSEHPVPNAVKVLEQVYFVGKDSYDPDSTGNLSYFWDFGDGSTSNQISPTNIYNQIGEYKVSLTINDSRLTSTRFITIIVFSEGGNYPIASIMIDAKKDASGSNYANVSEPIVFDASGSYDPDGSLLNYEWDFGDNKKSLRKTVVHEYDTDGIYSVVLTINDDETLIDQDTISITIGTGKPPKTVNNNENGDDRTQLGATYLAIAVVIIIVLVVIWLFLGRLRKRALAKADMATRDRGLGKAEMPERPQPRKSIPIPDFGRPAVKSKDQLARKARMDKLTANEGKMKQVMLRKKLQEERKKLDDDMKKELEDMGIEF
jgi:hypothetical protein